MTSLGTVDATHAPAVSEREQIERVKAGDKDAFREFYDHYARLVYRYIMARIANAQEAEDLTADTFVKAWRAIGSFQWRDTSAGAWLLRIAHNLMVDRYRKKSALPFPLHWRRGYEESRFAQIESQDVIRRGFASLSHDEQVILYLHYFEDWTIKDVADFFGKTPNAVQVAEFRALRRLRKVLKDARA